MHSKNEKNAKIIRRLGISASGFRSRNMCPVRPESGPASDSRRDSDCRVHCAVDSTLSRDPIYLLNSTQRRVQYA